MRYHINSIVKSCYFHLRRLGQIRPLLTQEAANSIAVSTVISRIDYCNSVFWGLSDKDIDILQKLQNRAARIVTRTKLRDHITPVLSSLHWLPVKRRIEYKVLCLAYSCVNGSAPEYLIETIPRHAPSRSLRSASQINLRLPSVDETNKATYGGRAFQNSAPLLWNDLPRSLKESENIQIFRNRLKTYLFKKEFSE